jgi:4-amino-4-deoxy-L-arabinose transferase-like glycosyltransferase
VLCIAAVLGLVLRLFILVATAGLDAKIVDEKHFTLLAINLVRGNGFGWGVDEPTSIRPPLYPALVAAIWRVTGESSFQVVRALQIGLAMLTAWLVYLLGRRAYGEDAGRYAAATVWLYPSLVFFNFTILTEGLFTLLLVMFVLLSVRLIQAPAATTAIACGVVLGLGALTRSVLWPLPLVLCPLLLLLLRGPVLHRLALSALVLAGFAVIVTPWALRNTRLQGVTTIVDTMGGPNIWMGNYDRTPEHRMWDAVTLGGERDMALALQAAFPGQRLTEGQKDKWTQKKGLEYMVAHPATTLRRAVIKLGDFWGLEREFAAGIRVGLYTPPSWLGLPVSLVIAIAYAAVALLFAAGVWLAPPEWRVHVLLLLPVVAIMGVHTLVFGHSRYHVPLIPIMALYGVALLLRARTLDLHGKKPAVVGALFSMTLLVGFWVRQLFVDGERIKALLGYVG